MQHGSDQNLNYACAKIHDLVLDQHMRYKCPVPNSNDTIGNRTRDLPACSAVPQPTAPPRAPSPLDQHMRYKCPVPNSWLCVLIIIIAKIPKNCVRNYRKATY